PAHSGAHAPGPARRDPSQEQPVAAVGDHRHPADRGRAALAGRLGLRAQRAGRCRPVRDQLAPLGHRRREPLPDGAARRASGSPDHRRRWRRHRVRLGGVGGSGLYFRPPEETTGLSAIGCAQRATHSNNWVNVPSPLSRSAPFSKPDLRSTRCDATFSGAVVAIIRRSPWTLEPYSTTPRTTSVASPLPQCSRVNAYLTSASAWPE